MGQPLAGGTVARRITHHRRTSWPFKVQSSEQQAVTEFGVGVPRRQEVEFADGGMIWLHRVEKAGVPELFLRDLGAPAEGVRVDLTVLVPDLAKDLPISSSRDVPGTVFYALRGQFKTLNAFLEAAVAAGRPA